MDINQLSVEQLIEKIKSKELKPSEIVKRYIERIEQHDPAIGAFLFVNKEDAIKHAEALDKLQDSDEATGELFGIPMGIKDNIVTKDVLTTAASRMLEDFKPVYDATVMEHLNKENAVLLGKLNLDEFAMGGSNETSYFKNVKNPWNQRRVPGGSSGGSAAAVAAGLVPFALGTDTGGSIRQPAAYCGIVGMKPTYGRVSRYGLIAFASSLDCIGPMTKNVRDNAKILEIISGSNSKDATTMPDVENLFLETIDKDIKGMKIALPKEYIMNASDEVKKAVLKAKEIYESLGATVEEVSLRKTKYIVSAYHIIASSEASANLARFDGIRYGYRAEDAENLEALYRKTRSEGFGPEVKRRILLGTFVLSAGHFDAHYLRAQKLRTLITRDVDDILTDYDLIMGPTTPSVAYEFDTKVDNPLEMYLDDILTATANLTGMPAISLPCGLDASDMPIGLQLLGRHFDEAKLYNAAHQFEKEFNLHEERNALSLEAK